MAVKHHVDVASHLANIFPHGNPTIPNGADCTQTFNYQTTHCGLECRNLRFHQVLIKCRTVRTWLLVGSSHSVVLFFTAIGNPQTQLLCKHNLSINSQIYCSFSCPCRRPPACIESSRHISTAVVDLASSSRILSLSVTAPIKVGRPIPLQYQVFNGLTDLVRPP